MPGSDVAGRDGVGDGVSVNDGAIVGDGDGIGVSDGASVGVL